MTASIAFWGAWIGPVALVAIIGLLARSVWKKATAATLKLKVERATAPFVAGVSVLAIAIPLVANFLLKTVEQGASSWVVGTLLAGLTLAFISLVAGGFVIYKIPLESVTSEVELSSQNVWLPVAMSVQFSGMIIFLVCGFITILTAVLGEEAKSSSLAAATKPVAVSRALPALGSSRADLLREWGTPHEQGEGWLLYHASDGPVLFYVEGDALHQLIYGGKSGDAQRPDC